MVSLKKNAILYTGIFIMLIATIISFQKLYVNKPNLHIDINVQDELVDDLDIFIAPNGYLLEGFDIVSDYGQVGEIIPLYSKGLLIDMNSEDITSYSDFTIYAKYKDKYAIIKSTNDIVMGSNSTSLVLHAKKIDDLLFISTGNTIAEYSKQPNMPVKHDSGFYSIEDFEKILDNNAKHMQRLYSFGKLMSNQ